MVKGLKFNESVLLVFSLQSLASGYKTQDSNYFIYNHSKNGNGLEDIDLTRVLPVSPLIALYASRDTGLH